jgi:phosphatidylserine decarboxylase
MTLFLSYLFGAFSKIERPKLLAKLSISIFSKAFGIDFSNARKKSFKSLYDMFTREIVRDTSYNDDDFIHPADGKLVSYGKVKDGELFLVKGKYYSLTELIGSDEVENFKNSYFYNYYLSPKDYHRVHHPVSGIYKSCYLIKGALYPVAGWFVKLCPSVFSKNARTVSIIESKTYGRTASVMVGALNVGSLEMSKGLFDEGTDEIQVGDHLGTFGLGSSVVVIINKKLSVKLGDTKYGDTL